MSSSLVRLPMKRFFFAGMASVFLITSVGCVGLTRGRGGGFEDRLMGEVFSDEVDPHDRNGEQYGAWDRDEPAEGDPLVQQRDHPAVDPSTSPSGSDDLFREYLKLHERLSERRASGYLLMWADARVYSSADIGESSSLGRLGYRGENRRAGRGQMIPVRVADYLGEAVEVETISRDEANRHCDGSVRGAISAYRLRMFIPRTEIVPVVAREFETVFNDGSVLFVPPGVPVRPAGDVLFVRLAGGGLEIPIEGRLDHIGLSYRESGFEEARLAPDPMPDVELDASSPLRLAGMAVQPQMLTGEAGRPRWVQENTEGPGTRVYMANRCIAAIYVTNDPDPVRGGSSSGFGASGSGLDEDDAEHLYEVKSNATAFWPNGQRAGVTISLARHYIEPEEIGNRLCFTVMGDLKVCHERADVRMVDRTEIRM